MNKIDKIIQESINKFLLREGLPAWKESGCPFRDRENIDVSNWYKIGIVDYSPYGNGTMDIWSNPEEPREYTFICTSDNGIGTCCGDKSSLPSYATSSIKIFDEYRDSEFSIPFLGKLKTDEDKMKHEEFMNNLNIVNGKVLIQHNSNAQIQDGIISYGHQMNGYSNNTDLGWYGWASKEIGRDPSNAGNYTYYCLVDVNDIYDMENNLKRYINIRQAITKEKYVAQFWDKEGHIVIASYISTPIYYILDKSNGVKYNANWEKIS